MQIHFLFIESKSEIIPKHNIALYKPCFILKDIFTNSFFCLFGSFSMIFFTQFTWLSCFSETDTNLPNSTKWKEALRRRQQLWDPPSGVRVRPWLRSQPQRWVHYWKVKVGREWDSTEQEQVTEWKPEAPAGAEAMPEAVPGEGLCCQLRFQLSPLSCSCWLDGNMDNCKTAFYCIVSSGQTSPPRVILTWVNSVIGWVQ